MADAVLELDQLSKRYGEVVALQGMTLRARAGEIFGFVGANGAGKTTAMRIALGVLAADSGEVRWNGSPITAAARRGIGYIPEERGLYPKMRLAEQLAYLAQLHGLRRARAQAAVDAWIERLGLGERRDAEVQRLSLGNQQRAQLAAALVHEPDALVLDEPFAGLDPIAVDTMSEVLREQRDAGVPVVFSSHQLDLVEQLCDRVGIVKKGRMVACGTVGELRSGGMRRLVVDAPQAPPGWANGQPGTRTVSTDGPVTLLELTDGADDQAVLRAAMETGPVREFSWRRPSLAELFRDVVTEDSTP